MRYKSIVTIITGLLFLASCASTNDNPDIVESYSLVYSSFQLSKDAQQKFADKAVESLNAIKNNADTIVDVKELKILLDSAKTANQKSITMINLAGAIDTTKYKEKALKYVNLLNSFYNNEFKEYINVLATQTKTQDKYDRSSKLLLPQLSALKKLSEVFTETSDEIREKYHLQVIDSVQNN